MRSRPVDSGPCVVDLGTAEDVKNFERAVVNGPGQSKHGKREQVVKQTDESFEEAEDEVVETHTLPRTSGPLPQLHNQFAHMAWHKTGWRELRVDPKESELSDDISEFTDTDSE